MDRYLCIHGHFYQPPRENPWLEAIEIQNSAHPYHDWNERITAECYAPNSASRILDGERRIMDIVSNYARMSFNFGPTVLSWMEAYSPELYNAILEADRKSMELRSGHGNGIAQVYNHVIMPLANRRDKYTQVVWGIKDFEYRFKRLPEGMWLAETAVDMETMDVLAECGIKFTILAQHQAAKMREIGKEGWMDVSGGRIDPTMAYLCRLPSGRHISVFFYDGSISRSVAFAGILNRGEDFVHALLRGFSEERKWPQLLNIATDGESYGHHHKFGDMALAYALSYIESNKLAKLTNYGEYLERHPPTQEVEIVENTSWSCMHGIERWRNNCGCNSGSRQEWNQEWRGPLRHALDWLRDELSPKYEARAGECLKNPWEARDGYINVIVNRTEESSKQFLQTHAKKEISQDEAVLVFKLLELQRHIMLMYTSCGWFFDELSGLETVQVLQYAGRAIQLSDDIFGNNLENVFLQKLSIARSNLPMHRDGAHVYEKFVKPGMIDLKKVGVHYAVSSLFEDYPDESKIYCYRVERKDYEREEAGKIKVAAGQVRVISEITGDSERLSFGVLHLGDQSLNGGVRTFINEDAYQSMKTEMMSAFAGGGFADIIRLMDKHFGTHNYSLRDLFRDEQQKILNSTISEAMKGFEAAYRQMYEGSRILMGFLHDTGMPVPKAFYSATEFTLGLNLNETLAEDTDVEKIQGIVNDIRRWGVSIDFTDTEFIVRHKIEEIMNNLYKDPSDTALLHKAKKVIDVLNTLPFEINFWYVQNVYYRMARTVFKENLMKAESGQEDAARWVEEFRGIGQSLFFNVNAVLSAE